jgi:putative peptidoglycan lipid II flippase
MVRLSGWTLGYVATNQIAQLFVLVLAKTGDSGDVTAYVYAFTFYVLPYGLLAVSLMTTMTPELARRAASGDRHALRRDFNMGLRYLIVLVLPASVLFAVLAQPIVGVLTVGGRFSEHSAHVTGDALQLFSLSLVPFSVYLYAMRGFYALHDTRTPFVLNTAENAINVGVALVLFPWLGVQGLALAWSVAYGVSAFSALARLRRRIGQVPDTGVRAATARAALGAFALAIVAIPLAGAIGSGSAARAVVAAGVAGTAGALAYLGMLAVLRSDELGAIVAIVRRRAKASAEVSP